MTTIRSAIELAAVVVLVTADLWLVWDHPWLLAVVRTLAAAVVIASLFRRRADRSTGDSGMSTGRAWLEAAFVTVFLGVAVAGWAAAASGPVDEPDLRLFTGSTAALGVWFGRHLALAFIQQLVLQLFLWPVARELLGRGLPATLIVAGLFGLGHLPSPPFAIATTIAAVLWIGLYRRSQRLAPLIASHVLLAALASTLPDRLFLDMKVGAPALEIAAKQRALAGADRQALLRAVATPSYAALRATDSSYVEGLYRDILGRLADDDEIRRGVEQVRATSRLTLAKRMLLATELDDSTLWRRSIDDKPLAPALEITPISDHAQFTGWYDAEGDWRWARDDTPAIAFPYTRASQRDHVLTLSGGTARPMTVELQLDGRSVGTRVFTDLDPRDHRFLLDAEQLADDGDQELRLLLTPRKQADPGTSAVVPGDSRILGFGLRQLRLAPLRLPSTAILHTDDDYFLEGFSIAEQRLRWTLAPFARLIYPLADVVPGGCYDLRLEAGAFERQSVALEIHGRQVADWTLDGLEPQIRSVRLSAEQLSTGPNPVVFHLPAARRPEGDPRQLGLAFISLRIYPLKDCRSPDGG